MKMIKEKYGDIGISLLIIGSCLFVFSTFFITTIDDIETYSIDSSEINNNIDNIIDKYHFVQYIVILATFIIVLGLCVVVNPKEIEKCKSGYRFRIVNLTIFNPIINSLLIILLLLQFLSFIKILTGEKQYTYYFLNIFIIILLLIISRLLNTEHKKRKMIKTNGSRPEMENSEPTKKK